MDTFVFKKIYAHAPAMFCTFPLLLHANASLKFQLSSCQPSLLIADNSLFLAVVRNSMLFVVVFVAIRIHVCIAIALQRNKNKGFLYFVQSTATHAEATHAAAA